jgi:hypothetical protein
MPALVREAGAGGRRAGRAACGRAARGRAARGRTTCGRTTCGRTTCGRTGGWVPRDPSTRRPAGAGSPPRARPARCQTSASRWIPRSKSLDSAEPDPARRRRGAGQGDRGTGEAEGTEPFSLAGRPSCGNPRSRLRSIPRSACKMSRLGPRNPATRVVEGAYLGPRNVPTRPAESSDSAGVRCRLGRRSVPVCRCGGAGLVLTESPTHPDGIPDSREVRTGGRLGVARGAWRVGGGCGSRRAAGLVRWGGYGVPW